jgi:hypothetical protein
MLTATISYEYEMYTIYRIVLILWNAPGVFAVENAVPSVYAARLGRTNW